MTRRALVFGGGGITGIAWEWGILAGLAERGVKLTEADLVVGTSAGSVVGAQVACDQDVKVRYEAQLAPLDGGVRSSANADLAAGYDRIVVIAPIARAMGPMAGVGTQIEALGASSKIS